MTTAIAKLSPLQTILKKAQEIDGKKRAKWTPEELQSFQVMADKVLKKELSQASILAALRPDINAIFPGKSMTAIQGKLRETVGIKSRKKIKK
jgi:hypothetical protein